MKYVIFSDVHSNYEALKTFLLYTDSVPNVQRLCLGDVVGYSTRPNECLRHLAEREIPIVMGNHDYAIYSMEERAKFNEIALSVLEWQEEILTPENRKMLVNLPFVLRLNSFLSITHGDFSEPEKFRYVTTIDQARKSLNAMTTAIGFFGHTHIPMVFTQYPGRRKGEDITCSVIKKHGHKIFLDKFARYLINPGSLGQPRDGEPRASFTVLNTDELSLTFHRYTYDYHTESQRIRDAKLPDYLAERLLVGY